DAVPHGDRQIVIDNQPISMDLALVHACVTELVRRHTLNEYLAAQFVQITHASLWVEESQQIACVECAAVKSALSVFVKRTAAQSPHEAKTFAHGAQMRRIDPRTAHIPKAARRHLRAGYDVIALCSSRCVRLRKSGKACRRNGW